MNTARKVGFQPTWDVLSEAELLGRKSPATVQRLTLDQAVKQAVKANLRLLAGRKDVAAGVYEVRKAIARYLPSVSLSGLASFIDADRANPMFGSHERALTGKLQVRQALVSEPALAGIAIQRSVQRGRVQELKQLRLDIMLATTRAYFNVFKLITLERLRKENLRVTQKNLELARVRQAVGASGLADVYRWEIQLANHKKAVISAVASRNQAEIALNALRRRPLEESFSLAGLVDLFGSRKAGGLGGTIKNPWSFSMMREFMVREGLKRAPELARMDRAIDAQRRALLSAKLAHVVPTLSFSFGLDHLLATGGATPDLSALGPLAGAFPEADDTSWSAGLLLSWSLFEGGAKLHRHRQSSVKLDGLLLQRRALAQDMEQRIRSAVHQAGGTYPGIALSNTAAASARKSMALVTEAYSRGTASITTLIDAQNAALNARLASALARCDFYLDFFAAQRAIANGKFFTAGDAARGAWFRQLAAYQAKRSGK